MWKPRVQKARQTRMAALFSRTRRSAYVFSGVRQSPGAETSKRKLTLEPFSTLDHAKLAAAEDGRTPVNRCGFARISLKNWVATVLLLVTLSVDTSSAETPEQRYIAAKTAWIAAIQRFHIPSAEAKGSEKVRLQNEAARLYQTLLKDYPEQTEFCASALRSLGNIHAAQGKLDEAVQCYRAVGEKYPDHEWEVLQSWKTAADMLWDANRQKEGREFYRRIVNRFDQAQAPMVVKMVVQGSKARLAQ